VWLKLSSPVWLTPYRTSLAEIQWTGQRNVKTNNLSKPSREEFANKNNPKERIKNQQTTLVGLVPAAAVHAPWGPQQDWMETI